MTNIATCDLALLAVGHNFAPSLNKGWIMRSFDKRGGDRSMVDALDRVKMHAAARASAKAHMRRAEAIINGAEDAWFAAGQFLVSVRRGVLGIARQLRTVMRRA